MKHALLVYGLILAALLAGGLVSAAETNVQLSGAQTAAVSAPENVVLPCSAPEVHELPAGIAASCPGGACSEPAPSASVPGGTGFRQDVLPEAASASPLDLPGGQASTRAPGVGRLTSGILAPVRGIYPGTHPAVTMVPVYASGGQEQTMVYYNETRHAWFGWGSLTSTPNEWYGSMDLITGPGLLYSPAISNMPSTGVTEIFVVDATGLWEKKYTGSVWTGWWKPPAGADCVSTPGAVSRSNGNTELVYVNTSGFLIHLTNTSGTWSAGEVIDRSHSFTDEGVSLVSLSPDSFDVIGHSVFNDHAWIRHWSQSGGWGSWHDTGLAAYSFVGATTRTSTNAGSTVKTIDIITDQFGDTTYYWHVSRDGGATWAAEPYTSSGGTGLVINGGSAFVPISDHYNRMEFLQGWNGNVWHKIYLAPTNSTIGVSNGGSWYLDKVGTGSPATASYYYFSGGSGSVPVVGDWNGDGKLEIGMYNSGSWYLDTAGTGNPASATYYYFSGGSGSVPVVGDWNGDGKDEIGVYNSGSWYLDWAGTGNPATAMYHYFSGGSGSVPVVGDWSGNGYSSIGVYNSGSWYLDTAGSGDPATATYAYFSGGPGSTPIVGDWTGTGSDKIGVYNSGSWYLDTAGTRNPATATFHYFNGGSGSVPVVGDWNGDGKVEIGVFNAGSWYVDKVGTGSPVTATFHYFNGGSGSTPLVGGWV